MSDVTQILSAIEGGDAQAAERLLPLVYEELRKLAAQKMAQENPGQTLQATALVHEAFLRLVGSGPERKWQGRRHFFAAAAEAMRRILIESARRKKGIKHGGHLQRQDLLEQDLLESELTAVTPPDELLALDEALTRLAHDDPPVAELVKLRYFAGLTIDQAARTLDISARTANRYWTYARAYLHQELTGDSP